MLIQKELEKKIIDVITAAFTTAEVDAPSIGGSWQTTSDGLVKWIESESGNAFVSLAVGCPQWQTFSTPVVNFAVTLSLFVRTELDPQGTRIAEVAEVLEDVQRSWQISTYQQSFTTLDLETLSVDGVTLEGGSSPMVKNGFCTVVWTLNLSGSYKPTSTN